MGQVVGPPHQRFCSASAIPTATELRRGRQLGQVSESTAREFHVGRTLTLLAAHPKQHPPSINAANDAPQPKPSQRGDEIRESWFRMRKCPAGAQPAYPPNLPAVPRSQQTQRDRGRARRN